MESPRFTTVGIVGAGAMGRGIAQLAAQAGSRVRLFDAQADAVATAQASVGALWDKLAAKGKFTADAVAAFKSRLLPASSLNALADCDLVIEAVIERLDVKKSLHAQLESVVASDALIASNTSSLSVTAIAAALKHPERFAGYHFFNPAPLMKVVEVVAGLKTAPAACEALAQYARQFGHTPVRTGDTPGFIVNHAGRGYSTEALRIVGEGIADFATVDRILTAQVGFRLGPFALFDLTALDVSQPAMEAIFRQYYDEPRYRPSVIAAQRLAGGVLGKKVGAGFYDYVDGVAQVPPDPPVPHVDTLPPVWVSARATRRDELLALLRTLGANIEVGLARSANALQVVAPLGTDVTTSALAEELDPARTIGIDLLVPDAATKRRVLATNPATAPAMRDAAHALFARDGKPVSVIHDSGGFVTQRVVATIVNIAADMCQQRICSPQDLDTAVHLGLGYPLGPLAMGDHYGAASILKILTHLQAGYGDPRYRPSPWLRRRAALGLSLTHPEG
ncbi:MAG: 3-hydroxyacyl-CoA dehydrogenase [Burkholderiaceae bacterium]|nr:MAG: 3-hydroxyacyl-CoA dehydrogenase [Burkholderiaceae bacterium]